LIPCYNVARFCEEVLREASIVCTQIIAIDDGSTDGTGAVLQKIASDHSKNIHVVTFPENRGKGFALIEGFKYALEHFHFDSLVTIDGDGQHFPFMITKLIKPLLEGADFVIGMRSFNEMPMRNRFANTVISFLLRLVYHRSPIDTQSGMRAFNPEMVKEFAESVQGGKYETEFRCLLVALKKRRCIVEIPIPTVYIEKNRFSHFCPWKDSVRILKVLMMCVLGKL